MICGIFFLKDTCLWRFISFVAFHFTLNKTSRDQTFRKDQDYFLKLYWGIIDENKLHINCTFNELLLMYTLWNHHQTQKLPHAVVIPFLSSPTTSPNAPHLCPSNTNLLSVTSEVRLHFLEFYANGIIWYIS